MTNPPYIVTRQMLANRAAENWRHQYSEGKFGWKSTSMPVQPIGVHRKLIALGPTPTPEQVNAVIGNSSWTRLTCDQCGNEVDTVIVVGQAQDYESSTASLCITCLEQAYNLAMGVRDNAS